MGLDERESQVTAQRATDIMYVEGISWWEKKAQLDISAATGYGRVCMCTNMRVV